MGADKLVGSPLHYGFIQVLGIEPGPVNIEGVADAGVINKVRIFLFDTGADGVEVIMNFPRIVNRDIVGQVRIERIGNPIHRNSGIGSEIGNVVLGMDAGICTAAAGDVDPVSHDFGCGTFHGAAYGYIIFLNLPTVVGGSFVTQGQGDISH